MDIMNLLGPAAGMLKVIGPRIQKQLQMKQRDCVSKAERLEAIQAIAHEAARPDVQMLEITGVYEGRPARMLLVFRGEEPAKPH